MPIVIGGPWIAPSISGTPSPSFSQGTAATYDLKQFVTFQVPSGFTQAATYTMSGSLGTGLTLNASTGVLSYDGAGDASSNSHTFTVTASTGSAVSDSFITAVTNAISTIPNITLDVGETHDMSQYVDQALTYTLAMPTLDPAIATFDPVTERMTGVSEGVDITVELELTEVAQSELLSEDFSSTPLPSPWYDGTAIDVGPMPGGDTGAIYTWEPNSVAEWDTPTGTNSTHRRLFTPVSNFELEFTFASTNYDTRTHLWYFKTTEEAPYDNPTANFTLYFEPDSDGRMWCDLRNLDGWKPERLSSVPHNLHDGNVHTVRCVVEGNTVGSADGTLNIYVDGVSVISVSNMEYFTVVGQQFNQILLGPYKSGTTPVTTTLYVGHVTLST